MNASHKPITVSVAKSKDRLCPANKNYFTVNVYTIFDLKDVITQRSWSPIVWKGGIRKGDNFLSCSLMVYDFDSGEMTISRAVENLKTRGLSFLVGTSKSHMAMKDGEPPRERFRIVIPIEKEINDKKLFLFAMKKYLSFFPAADQQTGDAARQYLPCMEIVAEEKGGALPIPILASEEASKPKRDLVYCSARFIPGWVRHRLKHPIPKGERNRTVFDISLALSRNKLSDSEIMTLIKRSSVDLEESEIRKIIQSSRSYCHE